MISADTASPVDRPNLSKDYLAGTAKEDWIPLRGPEFYAEQRIELLLETRVTGIDTGAKKVTLDHGGERPFGALLIATGADPVRLPVPGAVDGQVYYLRSFDDSKRIIERAAHAKRVVVVGASFIGLEVAASLRTREIDVDVVGAGERPARAGDGSGSRTVHPVAAREQGRRLSSRADRRPRGGASRHVEWRRNDLMRISLCSASACVPRRRWQTRRASRRRRGSW